MSWREIHAHLAAARDYARWAEVSVAALCEMPNAEACQRVIASSTSSWASVSATDRYAARAGAAARQGRRAGPQRGAARPNRGAALRVAV